MSAANLILRLGNRPAWDPYVLPRSQIKAWWDPADHGTANMTDDGSGLISNYIDRIGGRAITAATTARPTWAATSLNSAYPGLTFDGLANCFVTTTLTTFPTAAVAGELWAVFDDTAAAGGLGTIVNYGTANSNSRALQRTTATPTRGRISTLNSNESLNDATVNLTGKHIMMGYWSDTTQGGRIDGSDFSTPTMTIATLATGTARFRIGASDAVTPISFFGGVLGPVIITTILSAADRQRMEGYFAWTYGLTGNLPSTHPYKSVRP